MNKDLICQVILCYTVPLLYLVYHLDILFIFSHQDVVSIHPPPPPPHVLSALLPPQPRNPFALKFPRSYSPNPQRDPVRAYTYSLQI